MNFFSTKTIVILFFFSILSSCRNETTLETQENTAIIPIDLQTKSPEITDLAKITLEDLEPTSTTNTVVIHNNYTLSYHEKYEQPEWVAYMLKKNYGKESNFERPFFEMDEKVKTGSADWRNYKNSGYDRGHLCPAGDMKFSKKAFEETFLTSNISPQRHDFNEGVWNRLEQKIRYWATKYGEVYVVTGGVLQNGLKTIGYEKVAVPNYFYKIVAAKSNGKLKMIAFLVPHKESKQPLYTFVVSVDKIEEMTTIDFFPKLEDELENNLEQNADYKAWSFD